MEFQCIAKPQTESELAVMVCTLEAYGIPHYVQNQGFGGLYPGLQIDLYNVRRLMVPGGQTEDAFKLLSQFKDSSFELDHIETMTWADKIRVVGEILLFGWAFPTKSRKFVKGEALGATD